MTVTDILTRLEATPPILSDGRPLQDFLARDTSLGRDGAEAALREYRRFLALALAAPGELRMPGPMIAQLWQLHRDDSASYAAFLSDLGQGAGLATRMVEWRTHAQAYTETRRAYEAAFGPAPRRWWPARPKPPGTASYRLELASVTMLLQLSAVTAVFFWVKQDDLWFWSLAILWAGGLVVIAIALWREAHAPGSFDIYADRQTVSGQS